MLWGISLFILGIVVLGLLTFLLAKLLLKYADEAERHRKAEIFFAKYPFTDDEWQSIYQNEFVEDERGKGFFDKFASVISIDTSEAHAGKYIHFSDRGIYLVGAGERKSFSVNRLNLNGDGTHLRSIRVLRLHPLNKLDVQVHVAIDLVDSRVDHDLDFLIPLPSSAAPDIDSILERYVTPVQN